MKTNIIIKCLMTMKGYNCSTLAKVLGKSHGSAVTNALARENGMKIDTLLEMLKELDADLIIRSRSNDKTEWVID